MELSDLKVYNVGVPLHVRKSLAGRYHLIHPVSSGFGHQDGYKKMYGITSLPFSACLLPSTNSEFSSQSIIDT